MTNSIIWKGKEAHNVSSGISDEFWYHLSACAFSQVRAFDLLPHIRHVSCAGVKFPMMSKPKHTQVVKRRMHKEGSSDFDEAMRAWQYYLHPDDSSSSSDTPPETNTPTTADVDESGLDQAAGGEAQTPKLLPSLRPQKWGDCRIRVDVDTLMNMPTSSSDSSEPHTIEGMMTTSCDGIITTFTRLTLPSTPVQVQCLSEGEGWTLPWLPEGEGWTLGASGIPIVHTTKEPWRQSACFTRKHQPSERGVDRRRRTKKKSKVTAVVPAHEQVD